MVLSKANHGGLRDGRGVLLLEEEGDAVEALAPPQAVDELAPAFPASELLLGGEAPAEADEGVNVIA